MKFPEKLIQLLRNKKVVLVNTFSEDERIHSAVKGVVQVDEECGKVLIVDLYNGMTLHNLKRDPRVSIVSVDERHFLGYALQGRATIVPEWEMHKDFVEKWQKHVNQRISDRIVESVRSGKKSGKIFEAQFEEHPKHLIEVQVERIIDLSPR